VTFSFVLFQVVLEVPFYVTTKDVLIEEKRQVISLVSAANVVTPPTPVQKRRNKKSKINKPIFDVIGSLCWEVLGIFLF